MTRASEIPLFILKHTLYLVPDTPQSVSCSIVILVHIYYKWKRRKNKSNFNLRQNIMVQDMLATMCLQCTLLNLIPLGWGCGSGEVECMETYGWCGGVATFCTMCYWTIPVSCASMVHTPKCTSHIPIKTVLIQKEYFATTARIISLNIVVSLSNFLWNSQQQYEKVMSNSKQLVFSASLSDSKY